MKEMNNMFPVNAVHSKKKVIPLSLVLKIRLLKAIMENAYDLSLYGQRVPDLPAFHILLCSNLMFG